MEKSSILVTGTAGFSGRAIADHLVQHGHRVIEVMRTVPDGWFFKPEEIVFCGDLCGDVLDRIDGSQISVIVHAAATSLGRPETFALDNIEATRHVVKFAARHQVQLIFLSTISAFGEIAGGVVDPTTPSINPSPYGASKLVCEQLIAQAWEGAGAISLRLPGIVGKGAVRNWLSQIVAKAKAGEPIDYYGPTALFNNAIHIDSLANFIDHLIKRGIKGYDVVTLGASGSMTVRELVDTIVAAFGNRSIVTPLCSSASPFLISNERAIERYGYGPLSIRGTIRKYVGDSIS